MSAWLEGVRAAVLTAAETLGMLGLPPLRLGPLLALRRGRGLDQVEQAIRTLAGDVPGADAIGVSIEPGRG